MDQPLPPEFRPTRDEILRRNLAALRRDYRGRVPASGSGVRPRHTWPGLGEVAAGRSPGRRGSGTRGRRPAINCQKFTALCLFNRRGERSLSAPAKTRQPLREAHEGFWDDCPLPWPIVRMAGAAAR